MARSSLARVLSLLICTLTPWWAVGQSTMNGGYSTTTDTSFSFVYMDCLAGANVNNCWTLVPNAPLLNLVKVGGDGDLWGIEINGTSIVHFNQSTKAWIIQPNLAGVTDLAVRNSSAVYALAAGKVYKFTGSGWTLAFPAAPVNFVNIAVGFTDGDFWALGPAYGCGRQPYHFNASTNAWEAKQHGLANISVVDANNVYGSCPSIASPTDNVFRFTGSGWVTIHGWLSQLAVGPQSLDTNSTNITLWGVNLAPSIFHQNQTGSNGGWDLMVGAPQFVATGGEPYTYALFNNTLKHYAALRVNVSYAVTGNSPGCSSPGCTINHTFNLSLQLTGHTAKTASIVSLAANTVNIPVSDTMTALESASCVFGEGSASCPQVKKTTSVLCPVVGVIFADNAAQGWFTLWFEPELAETKLLAKGVMNMSKCKTVLGTVWCAQPVVPLCTANTTPPDLNPSEIWNTRDAPWTDAWMDYSICFRPHIGPWKGKWDCAPSPAVIRTTDVISQYPCTHNP